MCISKKIRNVVLSGTLLSCAQISADHTTSIEIRGAAFIPTAELFRDIYGGAAGDVQVEVAVEPDDCCYGLWVNADFAAKHGTSLGLKKSTEVKIVNLSFGARYLFDFDCCYRLALGFGPNIGHIRLENCTTCSPCKISKTSIGFVVKSDLYYDITECWFLDFFVDYRYQKMNFTDHVNVGGFIIGAGLGMNF